MQINSGKLVEFPRIQYIDPIHHVQRPIYFSSRTDTWLIHRQEEGIFPYIYFSKILEKDILENYHVSRMLLRFKHD